MKSGYLTHSSVKITAEQILSPIYYLEGEKTLCNYPKRKYTGYRKDDIIKGTLPNKEIMMAYISTQYKILKGRKQVKTNIKEIM
jgi:hypothetical protein